MPTRTSRPSIHLRFAIAAAVCCGMPLTAAAAGPDFSDPAFAESVVAVMSIDHLGERCRRNGGPSAADAKAVADWERDNQVELVRSRLAALARDASGSATAAKLRASVEQAMARFSDADSCRGAAAGTRVPAAQFAQTQPAMLESLLAAAGTAPRAARSGAPGASASAPPSAPAAAPRRADAAALAARIDSFGFDTQMRMGVGGWLYPAAVPVVLFRSGDALTDVEGLSFPGGVEAHRRAHPEDWTKWRRNGSQPQLLDPKEGWQDMAFSVTYGKLPAGFALSGKYRALSGAGTVAVGGTDSVTAWSEYTFSPDGRVIRGGGAGSYSAAGDVSTATSGVAPDRRGRYRIDGIVLRIDYDDRSNESIIIVTDPKDPKSVIWLDGMGYVQRK